MEPQIQAIICPECGKDRHFKDGMRKLSNSERRQRFICRSCGYRFTEPTSLNCLRHNEDDNQIGAEEAKNLDPVQKTKGRLFCAGDAKLSADVKGLLTQFYAYLEKEAYSVESDYVDKVKHLAVLGANLRDPEHVKTVIGHMQRKDG